MPVIEFLDQSDGDDFTTDEELPGEAEPPSRRAPVLAALLILALVLVALVQGARKHGHSMPVQPTPTPSPSSLAPAAVSTSDRVLVQDGQFLVTRGHELVSVRSSNGDNPAVLIDADTGAVRYELVGDAATHLVWVVGPTAVHGFDARTLATRFTIDALPAISDATVLDGALYVATADGVLRIGRGVSTVDRRPFDHLAADPTRHRVLALLEDRVGVLGSPGTVALPGPGRSITVADGAVWVTSTVGLYRLDPARLRAVQTVRLDASVTIVTSGRRSLLVRQGSALACLDATNGTVTQSWRQVPVPLGFDDRGVIYSMPARGIPATLTYGGCLG